MWSYYSLELACVLYNFIVVAQHVSIASTRRFLLIPVIVMFRSDAFERRRYWVLTGWEMDPEFALCKQVIKKQLRKPAVEEVWAPLIGWNIYFDVSCSNSEEGLNVVDADG
jgi:hypothetical protein